MKALIDSRSNLTITIINFIINKIKIKLSYKYGHFGTF